MTPDENPLAGIASAAIALLTVATPDGPRRFVVSRSAVELLEATVCHARESGALAGYPAHLGRTTVDELAVVRTLRAVIEVLLDRLAGAIEGGAVAGLARSGTVREGVTDGEG